MEFVAAATFCPLAVLRLLALGEDANSSRLRFESSEATDQMISHAVLSLDRRYRFAMMGLALRLKAAQQRRPFVMGGTRSTASSPHHLFWQTNSGQEFCEFARR
jgi:hypothetical protein